MEKVLPTISRLEVAEEIANAVTHGLGCILSMVGLVWLWAAAQNTPDIWRQSSALLFGSTLIILYAASTLYHSFRAAHLKRLFKKIDHCAIYTLIAGSYTPFTLITLAGPWGWFLFITVWSMALGGIIFKILYIDRWPLLSTAFYLAMGWLVLVAVNPLVTALPTEGLYLLVAGGLSYTVGAVVYVLEKPIFHHAIWHLFVMGGSLCHYFAVLFYVL